MREAAMRDIRGDLEERASFIEKQIAAAGNDFEKTVELLQLKLKAELSALSVAMLAEHYRMFLMDLLGSDRIQQPPDSGRVAAPMLVTDD
jgi:hypothetical protein